METNPLLALRYMAGKIDEYVKQAGRDTIMLNGRTDRARKRYARIPDGNACPFCKMLGSRGFVYRSEESAGGGWNTYHPHCNCQIAVSFEPGGYRVVSSGADGSLAARDYNPQALYREYLEAGREFKPAKSKLFKASGRGTERNLNIEIDSYVPCLQSRETGEYLATYVSEVTGKELKGYNKRTGWFVNWQTDMEIDKETGLPIKKYKLMVEGSDEIQGLIGIVEPVYPNDSLYVSWAVANPNSQSRVVGKENKEYIGIGGHLFAIACERSMELGRRGEWYGFARNSELFDYYVGEVGMEALGGGNVGISERKAREILGIYNYEWKD